MKSVKNNMGKKLAIEHHLIRPNEVIELLEMMGGKNKDNADGCSYLYYTLCTPKINNPNNDKVICGFTNLKMQNDHFAIFTLEKFWKKYPYKVGDKVVYEDDNDIVVISEIIWDDTVGDIFYNVKRIDEDDCFLCPPELLKPYKETNMNKKLAIRGHSTRGKEVIEILEMLGGKNIYKRDGGANAYSYYLFDHEILSDRLSIVEDDDFVIFTLEEFLEKYPFKIGDKVYTKSNAEGTIIDMFWDGVEILYQLSSECANTLGYFHRNELKPYKETNIDESKFGTAKKPLEPKSNAVKLIDGKVVDNLDKKSMNKKLAFWGDCNGYGYKIIRILEELGSINVSNYGATEVTSLYYIDEKNRIKCTYNGDLDKEKYVIMTYHDFIAKYPFQVGDIVYTVDNHEEGKIVKIIWRETAGRMRYLVDFENTTSWVFVDDIFCYEAKDNSDYGTAIEPMKVKSNAVKLVDNKVVNIFRKEFCECCGSQRCSGQDDELVYCERFKNLMDNSGTPMEEIKSKREYDELRMPLDDDDKLATEATIMGKKILPPDGYLVGKITQTDNGMLVEYVENKPKYPTTYEECCEILVGRKPNPNEISFDKMELCLVDLDNTQNIDFQNPQLFQLNGLFRLLMCRNAYWKIAGEQLGLDKSWESPFPSLFETVYCIRRKNNEIIKGSYRGGKSEILEFPTEEMRDAFYENFDDLIETYKELL